MNAFGVGIAILRCSWATACIPPPHSARMERFIRITGQQDWSRGRIRIKDFQEYWHANVTGMIKSFWMTAPLKGY